MILHNIMTYRLILCLPCPTVGFRVTVPSRTDLKSYLSFTVISESLHIIRNIF